VNSRLSVLILSPDTTGHVLRAIGEARRHGHPEPEILVLCGPSVAGGALSKMEAACHGSSARCIVATRESPGALRNAAVAAAGGDLVMFLEAGDRIDARYIPSACARLAADPDLAAVSSWADGPGAAGVATLLKPSFTLAALLSDRAAIPGPTVLRRAVWESVGGFDEDLPACEWYEFWIRVLAAGARGDVIESSHLRYEPSRESAHRRRLVHEPYLAAMRQVLEKHRDLLAAHVADVLCDREVSLNELYCHYRGLLRVRDDLVAERRRLLEATERTAQGLRDMHATGIDWGDLRRLLPVSPDWGYERGVPIDRYYIERFLEAHAGDVQGVVLEVQESDYTRRFGGDRVRRSDVIDIDPLNSRATLVGDLRRLEGVPSATYDCFILTQTIHVIENMHAVLREAERILKPGGVLLVTLPCASRVCLEYGRDGDFWRVTEAGARQLFSEVFPSTHLHIESFGNVLTNVAFLEGLACHEISAEEFEVHDPFHTLLVGVRAVKPGGTAVELCRRRTEGRAAILLYHRVCEASLDVHGLAVSPDEFRAQMAHLASGYRLMPLAQLGAAVREGWLPERAVAITFDDGYVDNLQFASPILLEAGIPATFFITSAGLLGVREFWWDTLASIFFGAASLPKRLEVDWDGETLTLPSATAEERQQAHWALYHRIRTATPERQSDLVQRLRQWAEVAPDDSARPMTREELEALVQRPGHSLGGHGTHHLSYCAHSPDVVCADVWENRTLLEATTGRVVASFAYPFGDHDDIVVGAVGSMGYRVAVTCVPEIVHPGMDPLRLPRFEIKAGGGVRFEEYMRALFEERAGAGA
jgi:peptidoglycan/xylan/chitin deacetylase (PgdA/CDA1 family)/SAM-dependent methyltransferase